MKRRFCFRALCGVLLLYVFIGGAVAQSLDPTQVRTPLADTLKAQLVELRALKLCALVAGADDDGIALVQSGGQAPQLIRPDSALVLSVGDMSIRVKILGISEKGVEVEAPALREHWLVPVSYTHSQRFERQVLAPQHLAYVEFNQVALGDALRMLADQTGENYVATETAAKVPVSLFLRHVSPKEVVEELCKSHGLWYRTTDNARVSTTRILTMEEFRKNLASQQLEELSETFTLLYPNVTEVASIIQGIYADRVYLSLGDEDILDDELDDLSRRFERFNMFSGSGSTLMQNFDLRNNFNRYSSRSSYSRNNNRWNYLNQRDGVSASEVQSESRELRELQATDAARVQHLLDAGGTASSASLTEVLQELRRDPASVYVTISRRNNILVVRTGDPRVMDDIRSLVKQLDVPTPMVLLEVKVFELSLTDELNTIFDYSAQGDFRLFGRDQTTWDGSFPASAGQEKAMNFQLVSEHFTARVQLLQEKGNAKLLATPTLLTANNEVSQLFIGKEVPIVRNVSSETIVTDNNIITSPETEIDFQRVGTLLLITPNINADRTVTLRLLQENSDLASEKGSIPVVGSTGQVQYVPVDVVEARSISGTFVAHDQMCIAIGGMIREKEAHVRSGIPILMDIPLLGWFFRSTQKVNTRTELIILITPHVMVTPSESGGITTRFLESNSKNPQLNPSVTNTVGKTKK